MSGDEKRKPTTEDRIAANLKAIRSDNGLSQEKVAAAMTELGYSWHQATVYKVEQGERQVQLGEADALAKVFDVPLADLIATPAEATAAVRLSAYYRELIRRCGELGVAHEKWQDAQKKLADVVDVDPWGDKAAYASAFENLQQHIQRDIRVLVRQSVVDVVTYER